MWRHLNGSLMLQNTHIKKWLDGNPAVDNADMIERDRAWRGQREWTDVLCRGCGRNEQRIEAQNQSWCYLERFQFNNRSTTPIQQLSPHTLLLSFRVTTLTLCSLSREKNKSSGSMGPTSCSALTQIHLSQTSNTMQPSAIHQPLLIANNQLTDLQFWIVVIYCMSWVISSFIRIMNQLNFITEFQILVWVSGTTSTMNYHFIS